MIVEVNETNIIDAAKIYMESWKESHKDICYLNLSKNTILNI